MSVTRHTKSEIARLKSAPVADGGGLRYNTGKNQIELMPPEWIWNVGMVLTRGAIKYEVRNWERGMKWSYLVGCAMRHLLKFVCGERYDRETGCHHLAMVAWNALALMTYDIRTLTGKPGEAVGVNDLVGNLAWLNAGAIEPGPELQAIINAKSKTLGNSIVKRVKARFTRKSKR